MKITLGRKWSFMLLLTTALTATGATKSAPDKPDIGPKRILVLLPVAFPSHHNVFSALTNELLDRGHYLTIVSSREQKQKHPRLREILIRDPHENLFTGLISGETFFKETKNPVETIKLVLKISPLMSEVVLESSEVLALKNEKFDLVMAENLFFQEPLLGFAHHFGCPSLVLNPFGYATHINELTGGAVNPAYVPNVVAASVQPKTFLDRLKNTVILVISMLAYHLYYLPKAEAQMRTVFPDAPPLYDLINNISLTLINNKDALMYPVPLAPSVIEIGGIHIKPGKPLPVDLKKWIEDSKDGIVYFSLGSNLPANLMPKEKLRAILKSFGKLKQRVLIKWNAEIPENAPKNCRFEEWLPQQEVLAHPNLKVFVTHGGLLSTQESVYYGVPIIGMPAFADQFMNTEMAVEKGFALKVSLQELSTEALDSALAEIINNPRYRQRSQELSQYFLLDPVQPLDKAVYYTEQLMKLGSFKHLQPSSVNLHWYQYLLLDVMAVIALALYVVWKIFRCVCSTLLGCCCKSSKSKKD